MSLISLPRLLGMIVLIVITPLLMIAAISYVSAQSNDVWGAIFFDFDDRVMASSTDAGSQDEAKRVAKQKCESGGGRNCELVVEFQTNECGALAVSQNDWGADYGPSKDAAEDNALKNCKKQGGQCKVEKVVCNNDSGSTAAPAPAPLPPVNLAFPLQSELKRLGCLTGRVDGVWGSGSRAALRRFSSQAGLRLGSEPSQNALDEAKYMDSGYCTPVSVAPKRKKPSRPSTVKKKVRCSKIKFAFTRGNTCSCSGGRIFTGSACVRPY